eukprot:g10567.t1
MKPGAAFPLPQSRVPTFLAAVANKYLFADLAGDGIGILTREGSRERAPAYTPADVERLRSDDGFLDSLADAITQSIFREHTVAQEQTSRNTDTETSALTATSPEERWCSLISSTPEPDVLLWPAPPRTGSTSSHSAVLQGPARRKLGVNWTILPPEFRYGGMHFWRTPAENGRVGKGILVSEFLRTLQMGVWRPQTSASDGGREGNLIERVGTELPELQNTTEYMKWVVSGKRDVEAAGSSSAFARRKGKAFLLEHFEHIDVQNAQYDGKERFRHTFSTKRNPGRSEISYQYVSNLRQCGAQVVSSYRQITHHHGQGAFFDVLRNQRALGLVEVDGKLAEDGDLGGKRVGGLQPFYPFEHRHMFPALDDAFFLDGNDLLDTAMHQDFQRRRLENRKADFDAKETGAKVEALTAHVSVDSKTLSRVETFFRGAHTQSAGPLPFTFGKRVAGAVHGENVFLSPLQEHIAGVSKMQEMTDKDTRVWTDAEQTFRAGAFAAGRIRDRGSSVSGADIHDRHRMLTETQAAAENNDDDEFDENEFERFTNLEKQMRRSDLELQKVQEKDGAPFPTHLLRMHEDKRQTCRGNENLRLFGCAMRGNGTWFSPAFHADPRNFVTAVSTQFGKFSLQANLLAGRTDEIFHKYAGSDENLRLERIAEGSLSLNSEVHDTFGKGYSHFRRLPVEEDVRTFEVAVRRVLDPAFRRGAGDSEVMGAGGFAIVGVLDKYNELMEMLECVFPTFFRQGSETLRRGMVESNKYTGGSGEYFKDRGIVFATKKGEDDVFRKEKEGTSHLAKSRLQRYEGLSFLLDFAFGRRNARESVADFLSQAEKLVRDYVKEEVDGVLDVESGDIESADGTERDTDRPQARGERRRDLASTYLTAVPVETLHSPQTKQKLLARIHELKAQAEHVPLLRNDTSLSNFRYRLVSVWRSVERRVLQLGPKFPLARVRSFAETARALSYITDLEKHKTAQEKHFIRFMRGLFGGWCAGSPDDLLYRIAKKRFLALYEHARSRSPDGKTLLESACCRKFEPHEQEDMPRA